MSRFLIFARPRSRTAWLANFLTYGDTYCLHEPLAECATLAELVRRLDQPFRFGADVQALGFADTSLIHRPGDALDAFPGATALFVASKPDSWHRFARTHKLPPELVELVDQAYERTCARLVGRAHFIDAHELTSSATAAKRAWDVAGARKPFPMARWHALRDLNVQVDAGDLAARIRRMTSG